MPSHGDKTKQKKTAIFGKKTFYYETFLLQLSISFLFLYKKKKKKKSWAVHVHPTSCKEKILLFLSLESD